jgi:hypothetical protein
MYIAMGLGCPLFLTTGCNELAKRLLSQSLCLVVTWPLLGQHYFPYHQDKLWLNLEERAVLQLRVHIFERDVIKQQV